MTHHVSRHHLEQLIADDPRGLVPPALRVHVADCDHCSVRKRALEAARAQYLSAQPAAEFARGVLTQAAQPEPPRRRRFFWF
jgi:hypothetical protein